MLTTGYHIFLRGPAADGISALHPSDYAVRFHTFAMYEVLQLPQPPNQPMRRSTGFTDFGGRLWVPYYLCCCGFSCMGAGGEESLTLLDGRKARGGSRLSNLRWGQLWQRRRRGLVKDRIEAEKADHMQRIGELEAELAALAAADLRRGSSLGRIMEQTSSPTASPPG